MTDAIRAVLRRVHHLPWVCAAIILTAGLANWVMFSRKEAPPAEPEKQSGVMLDEKTFRQLVNPAEGQPFGADPAQQDGQPEEAGPFAAPGFPFADAPVNQENPNR